MVEYIVTGGAGFIGSAIVWELNNRGISNILVVDNLAADSEKWKNLVPLKYYDYVEKEDFLPLLSKHAFGDDLKAVIHMGACSSTTEKNAGYLVRNNYEYSKELAKIALLNKIRFMYASSAATYGNGEMGYVDDEKELEKLRPMNMYGYSKQMFDLWIKNNELLQEVVGFKFTNVFGPNEWHKGDMKSIVCKAYYQILETGKIKLFKSKREDFQDGEQKRDFIYIKDVVKMVLHFLISGKNGIYNIGSGRAETWNHLAKSVFKALGKTPVIEYIDMPENISKSYQYYTKAEMGKLRNAEYDTEVTSLEDAVSDYVQNYLLPEKRLGA